VHFLLGRHQHPLPLFRVDVVLINLTNIDVVHLGEEFARGDVASGIAGTHMAKAALRILTERITTVGCSGLVSKCIKLDLV